jgi:hypothetical protein
MVDEVLGKMSGYGLRSDAVAYLPSSITDTSTTFVLTSADLIGRGVIEVEDELIWVDAYDAATGAVTVPPYGRGFLGTVAASHAANVQVRVNPMYTRNRVKQEINATIRASYPSLWGVQTSTFTFTPMVNTYAIPSTAEGIISIKYRALGPSKESIPIRNYRMDPHADIVDFGSNSTVTILSAVQPGATVSVTASIVPEVLEHDYDDFSDTTGLPYSCMDVIVLGACHRLLSFTDAGRLQHETPEGDVQSAKIQIGSGVSVAKYIYALFTQRMTEEAGKLLRKYPVRVHYTN